MLCRAILTAIAISYVICVLLLSGLQKEELDANTMEKLRRHNVNIYDMNNESLRQECLLKSFNAAKANERFEMNEDKNNTRTIPINRQRQTQTDVFNTETAKSNVEALSKYFGSREDLRSLIDEIKIKGVIHREPIRSDNIKGGNVMPNVQDEINITMVNGNKQPQINYIRSQPSLDTVLKFWSQFTRKPIRDTDDVITFTTTYNPPRIEEVIQSTVNTDNKGYAHSREKEYINRIISEYLASQKIPTTTQVIKKKRKNKDVISKKIKELLTEKAKDEEIDPIVALKNMGDVLNLRTLSELADFSGPIRINNKDSGAKKPHSMTAIDKKHDNDEPVERLESELYNPVANFSPMKVVTNAAPEMEALKYLDAFLRLNKESKVNTEPAPYTEITTEDAIININEQESNERWNKDVHHHAENVNSTNRDLNQVQSREMAKDQVVSADVIQKIAEKVKEIVLKDIRKTTTEVATTITTTVSSSTALTIATAATEVPAISLKDTKNGKQMLETLMELFKEYKAIKETTVAPIKSTTKSDKLLRNPPVDRLLPPIMSGSNPYERKPKVPSMREIRENPYKPSLVQIPLGPADRALQATTYNNQANNFQNNEYKVLPITIQTNSVEVAPLAIPLPKPIPLINQHIIVTSPNPFARHREQPKRETEPPITGKYREVLSVGDERNHRAENPTYAELAKKLRAAEDAKQEFRDSYKDRIQKLKERIKHAHEHNREKARELNQALGSDHRISRLAEPSYHGGLIGSGHQDSLNRPFNLNNRDVYSRPLGSSPREQFSRPLDPNLPETVNRALNLNLHDNFNSRLEPSLQESLGRQADSNRQENYNRPIGSSHRDSLNRQLDLNQYAPLNRQEDPNQRDIITREVLSRLVGSNHHDVISRLVEPSPHDVINRPVDLNQQSRSHHSDAYERIEHEQMHPRFKGARFHEELERIEGLPRDSYSNDKSRNCCEGVAAREQLPLTKIKQRGRFDDTHFRNFLKSQQKVTDMLERILASKAKQERPSVEIS